MRCRRRLQVQRWPRPATSTQASSSASSLHPRAHYRSPGSWRLRRSLGWRTAGLGCGRWPTRCLVRVDTPDRQVPAARHAGSALTAQHHVIGLGPRGPRRRPTQECWSRRGRRCSHDLRGLHRRAHDTSATSLRLGRRRSDPNNKKTLIRPARALTLTAVTDVRLPQRLAQGSGP